MPENYPLPVFNFKVEWGGGIANFSEVSGLTMETQPIEYRHGMMKETSPLKLPGMQKFSNITLKRGIAAGDNDFAAWLTEMLQVRGGGVDKRRDLIISLLDEAGEPVTVWNAKKAWPVKVEGPGLKSTGNEIAIESIEVAHEGLTVEHV